MAQHRDEKWGLIPLEYYLHLLVSLLVAYSVTFAITIAVNGTSFPSLTLVTFPGNFTEARLLAASETIMQFDSFVTAAWVAGFAFFWGFVTRESRAVEQEINAFSAIVQSRLDEEKSSTQESTGKELIILGNERVKKLTKQKRTVFVYTITPILSFVGSGVFAIIAILTAQAVYVWGALLFLIQAIMTALFSWYELYEFSETLSTVKNAIFSDRMRIDRLFSKVTQDPSGAGGTSGL